MPIVAATASSSLVLTAARFDVAGDCPVVGEILRVRVVRRARMRRPAIIAATAAIAGCSLVVATSADAAGHQPKPRPLKVMKGAYTATAVPDPTMEATGLAGMECANIDPA